MQSRPLRKLSEITGRRVAAGILSWKSDRTLERTLSDHRERGLFELFDEVLIHFQEVREVDLRRAEHFGLRCIGSERNRHIGGGFYHLIKHLDADYVLQLEDDLTLAAPVEQLADTLADAIRLMDAGHMDEFLCRRDDMVRSGYEKFHRIEQLDREHIPPEAGIRRDVTAMGRWIRRARHPHQADKHLGKIVWFEREPERVRPDVVTKVAGRHQDFYVVRGPGTKWANPALLARRAHFLEVYGHVSSQVPGFEAFGKSLEGLINDGPLRPWWLAQNYRIGFTKPVLMLHGRLDDGGKLASRIPAPHPLSER